MVNQLTIGLALPQRHLQRFLDAVRMQIRMQMMSHDSARMRVGHQAQVSR